MICHGLFGWKAVGQAKALRRIEAAEGDFEVLNRRLLEKIQNLMASSKQRENQFLASANQANYHLVPSEDLETALDSDLGDFQQMVADSKEASNTR